eukprot:CAMPEP_0184343556 /NCGR_PEP_ID=MMETSP1089-20130417/12062_1 /TAXON_ID=38269 ORGANISM="Gloeochaete wittrockiana, Strain SAG46.84" /NCGR_SAMPLE_ID=MMETSP1089 /ASSEMBLY_ACC=CAM_ASM_000445 /LENGTH=382 /DNA_ID=CAMNT_0026672901 /DNA_START=131 /DNA_END=1276 /DNA_ORIENTATION=+
MVKVVAQLPFEDLPVQPQPRQIPFGPFRVSREDVHSDSRTDLDVLSIGTDGTIGALIAKGPPFNSTTGANAPLAPTDRCLSRTAVNFWEEKGLEKKIRIKTTVAFMKHGWRRQLIICTAFFTLIVAYLMGIIWDLKDMPAFSNPSLLAIPTKGDPNVFGSPLDYAVLISLGFDSIDTTAKTFEASLHFKYIDLSLGTFTGRLKQTLTLAFVPRTVTIPSGTRVYDQSLRFSFQFDSGNRNMYPLDYYIADLNYNIFAGEDLSDEVFLSGNGTVKTAVYAPEHYLGVYQVGVESLPMSQGDAFNRIRITFSRTNIARVYPFFVTCGMMMVFIAGLFVMYFIVLYQSRPVEAPLINAFAAGMFALPTFRGSQSGVPEAGILLDW